MNTGWIKLHRQLMTKGYYKDSQYIHLWCHILMKANHADAEFLWNGKLITVKRGQLITGRDVLSSETGIHRSKIERILKVFKNEQQIEQQTTNKFRLITVLKYSKYQGSEQQNEQPVSNKRATSEHKQEEKEYKKKKKVLSAKADEPYSLIEKLNKMKASKDKRMPIIGYYWQIKEIKPENADIYKTALNRELKASGLLKGYKKERIRETILWLHKNADFKWTLETVVKYIDENLTELGRGGKPITEEEKIDKIINS